MNTTWIICDHSQSCIVNGHRLQDGPYDMEIRGFGNIKVWDGTNVLMYGTQDPTNLGML